MKGFSGLIHLWSSYKLNKLLKQYEMEMAQSEDSFWPPRQLYSEAQAPFPELREGFTDMSLLEEHKEIIQIILAGLFSSVLTTMNLKQLSTYTCIIFKFKQSIWRIFGCKQDLILCQKLGIQEER